MEEDFLGIRSVDTGIGSAGVGYVVIPKEIDREQYIQDCYRTNTLTINGGMGYGYLTSVPVDVNVMQNIKFPTDENNRGTPVIWVRDAVSHLPVIVGALRKQENYYSLSENQYRLFRGIGEKSVEVFLNGNNTDLQITLLGDKEDPANVNIKVTSQNKDSVFNLFCDNEINVFSESVVNIASNQKILLQITDKGESKMSLTYEKGIGLKYEDEFENKINVKDEEVNIISKKINHNEGKEPMVLGDTLAQLLSDFLDACQNLSFMSPAGQTSIPINVADFVAIKGKLDKIKSKISNLD